MASTFANKLDLPQLAFFKSLLTPTLLPPPFSSIFRSCASYSPHTLAELSKNDGVSSRFVVRTLNAEARHGLGWLDWDKLRNPDKPSSKKGDDIAAAVENVLEVRHDFEEGISSIAFDFRPWRSADVGVVERSRKSMCCCCAYAIIFWIFLVLIVLIYAGLLVYSLVFGGDDPVTQVLADEEWWWAVVISVGLGIFVVVIAFIFGLVIPCRNRETQKCMTWRVQVREYDIYVTSIGRTSHDGIAKIHKGMILEFAIWRLNLTQKNVRRTFQESGLGGYDNDPRLWGVVAVCLRDTSLSAAGVESPFSVATDQLELVPMSKPIYRMGVAGKIAAKLEMAVFGEGDAIRQRKYVYADRDIQSRTIGSTLRYLGFFGELCRTIDVDALRAARAGSQVRLPTPDVPIEDVPGSSSDYEEEEEEYSGSSGSEPYY